MLALRPEEGFEVTPCLTVTLNPNGRGCEPLATNYRIETLNGTSKKRVRVQRGWKSMEPKIAEGQRIQYNFVRPHMALENQTPAEAAGIGVNGRKKRMKLLTEAITHNAKGYEITQ